MESFEINKYLALKETLKNTFYLSICNHFKTVIILSMFSGITDYSKFSGKGGNLK